MHFQRYFGVTHYIKNLYPTHLKKFLREVIRYEHIGVARVEKGVTMIICRNHMKILIISYLYLLSDA